MTTVLLARSTKAAATKAAARGRRLLYRLDLCIRPLAAAAITLIHGWAKPEAARPKVAE